MLKKLLIGVVLLCGCTGFNPMLIAPIAQIGVYWVQGEAHKYYNSDFEVVHRSLLEVFQELDLPVISDRQEGATKYVILAGDTNRFSVKILKMNSQITKLSIRVDVFGDKPYADLIYRKVDQKTGIKVFHSVSELQRRLR